METVVPGRSWMVAAYGALLLAGCSVILPQASQCESDGDCRLVSHVCVEGLCVPRDAGNGPRDGGNEDETVAWVLAYFTNHRDLAADSLHLAYSTDGLRWIVLAEGRPVYTVQEIGTNHIRDPHLFRKNDGTFVLLATDATLSTNDRDTPSSRIFAADSTDLIEFTNPRLLQVTDLEGPAGSEMHARSPEAFYDPERREYGILWAGNDTSDVNRIYVSYVDDAFTIVRNRTPQVFFDPGYSVMNPTLARAGDLQYLFFTDVAAGGDVQVARSTTGSLAPGSFMRWSPQHLTTGHALAPFVVSTRALHYVYANFADPDDGTGCWSATDLGVNPGDWVRVEDHRFPRDASQASAVRVTQAELDALIAAYGSGIDGVRIRTTLVVNGSPQYVLHEHHNVVGPLGLTEHGIRPDDYLWRIRPGLANPDDDSLVSIESATRPGMFWRVRSANPDQWPPANGGHYRDETFDDGTTVRRNYLVYLDRYVEGDSTFAADATFRRVPAANGNSAMTSFRWYPDVSRYVGVFEYHLVAQERAVHGSDDLISFAIEDD